MNLLTTLAETTVTQSTNSLIWVGLIAALSALMVAVIPIFANTRANRKLQQQNWAREDAVAERAAEVAEHAAEAVEAAKEVAVRVQKVAEVQAVALAKAEEQMQKIIHQTDGLYTAQQEVALRALVNQTATLREVVALRESADSKIDSTRTLQVITENETQIAILEEALQRRALYQESLSAPPSTSAPVEVKIVNEQPVDVLIREDTQPSVDQPKP